jgi:hypothetical protein
MALSIEKSFWTKIDVTIYSRSFCPKINGGSIDQLIFPAQPSQPARFVIVRGITMVIVCNDKYE